MRPKIDDAVIEAAKQKLAAIAARPGYADAMRRGAAGSRRSELLMAAAIFGVLAFGSWAFLHADWSRATGTIAFGLMSIALLAKALRTSPHEVSNLWPVAILHVTPAQGDEEAGSVVMLDEHGAVRDYPCDAYVCLKLNPGEIGIAVVGADKIRMFRSL